MAKSPPPISRVLTHDLLKAGAAALARRDRDLARVLSKVKELPMWGRRPGFATMIHIILEQQVSIAAARTLFQRLRSRLGEITPQTVHDLDVTGLRDFGLTRQKAAYCHGMAARVLAGSLDFSSISRAPDPVGRSQLLAIHGVGPWSVDVYYLMALRRPDIWPQGDLALAASMLDVKGLQRLPSHKQQLRIAEQWAPWRSVAARILWAHYLSERRRD